MSIDVTSPFCQHILACHLGGSYKIYDWCNKIYQSFFLHSTCHVPLGPVSNQQNAYLYVWRKEGEAPRVGGERKRIEEEEEEKATIFTMKRKEKKNQQNASIILF